MFGNKDEMLKIGIQDLFLLCEDLVVRKEERIGMKSGNENVN